MAELAAFTQSLTAQAIVKAADREAGSPGSYLNDSGSETLAAPGYVKLQAILDHEALTGDWPFRFDAITVAVTGRTTGLPSDFWNTTFAEAYYIHPTTGERPAVRIVDRQTFHQTMRPSNQMDGPPEQACIVKNQGAADGGSPSGVVMVDPVWTTHYVLELHYSPLPIPLAAITTKPWLPHSLFLIKRLAAELFSDQDDPRVGTALAVAQALKDEMTSAKADAGQRPKLLRMNPDIFVPPRRV